MKILVNELKNVDSLNVVDLKIKDDNSVVFLNEYKEREPPDDLNWPTFKTADQAMMKSIESFKELFQLFKNFENYNTRLMPYEFIDSGSCVLIEMWCTMTDEIKKHALNESFFKDYIKSDAFEEEINSQLWKYVPKKIKDKISEGDINDYDNWKLIQLRKKEYWKSRGFKKLRHDINKNHTFLIYIRHYLEYVIEKLTNTLKI